MSMVEGYHNPVFYCTNDDMGEDIEDEDGYETGNLFTLDTLVEDIAACSNGAVVELIVGHKVQATIIETAADNYVAKIAASSGAQLLDLLRSFGDDPETYIATIDGIEVNTRTVLGQLSDGNQRVEVTITK
ncbi:hypothetical protein EV183_001509 [Coemansia sp. RSA 2336]|nr:hypothetical protein EV183_001509 [Coemansia sp. RSA 2336]